MKPRQIAVSGMEIDDLWKNYLAVEDGNYLLEDSGDKYGAKMLVTLHLKLLKRWGGGTDPEAKANDTIRLYPLSPGGAEMSGPEFTIASGAPQDKFNNFVLGSPGDKANITFSASFYRRDADSRNDFKKISGFEAVTVAAPKRTADEADDKYAGDSKIQSGGTEEVPKPASRRTGPRTIAVPELEITGNVSRDTMLACLGQVESYLLDNSHVKNIISYDQIARITKRHRFETSDWSSPDKYAEIGNAVNADTVVASQPMHR
jgi:hypothetical protein